LSLYSYLTFVKEAFQMSVPATSTAMNTAQIILNKAIPLFASSGYAGVSMRDIANEVGMSGAALYHHYPDKQSLYVAAMGHAFTDKAAGIASALDSKGTALDRPGLTSA
jgi:AcrR family transcriptional regulator